MTGHMMEAATLQQLEKALERTATSDWSWNCAGEIFATFEGERVRIGHFQGSEAEAAAVCQLFNHSHALIAASKKQAG